MKTMMLRTDEGKRELLLISENAFEETFLNSLTPGIGMDTGDEITAATGEVQRYVRIRFGLKQQPSE